MNNRVAGLLLLGLSFLTAVIVYALRELIDSIKDSAGYLGGVISGQGSSSLAWGSNIILSNVPIYLLLLAISISIYLIWNKKE
ncbi:hypothetical protein AB685_17050 [Bacillus sp. LL01]|uniref:hypothetical protein n=1 Tax=Bacillus sp. LL01 TaxID=1665556 RepID=UPI00064CED26|nr:hypothetical protein [Bacillus sp. LL01]KMJ57123.1 hypothetical protein AB685_17050 [Bacillus sp. LL01]